MDEELRMDPTSLLLIVAAGAAFYFLIIRPGKQRQKAQAQLQRSLQPGTEVMTTSGIFGTVAVVTEEELSLEVSPGVFMRIIPAAVARVVQPAPQPEVDEAAPEEA
jgi:preprotein translocase subunit YajC